MLRASGLKLVVSAIILWNTVYLEKALAKIGKQQAISKDYLTHLSLICWNHINLTRDYVWPLDHNP